MIPIAQPLADAETERLILEATKRQLEQKELVSGIKDCQKWILEDNKDGLVVFNGETSPMDLITHIPILCEERGIEYVFVKSPKEINGFTCVVLKGEDEIRRRIKNFK